MKSKTLILLVCLCGLLAWLGLKEDSSKHKAQGLKDPTPFDKIEFNSIDELRISKGGDELHLKWNGEKWEATSKEVNFTADFAPIKKLLLEVRDTEWLSQPARDDRFDSNFGLDKDSQPGKLELIAKDKTILSLSLGKGRQSSAPPGPMGYQPEQGQHIRVEGTPGVFFARDRLNISIRAGEWINKVLAKAEVDQITNIELHSLGRKLTFTKETKERKDAGGNVLGVDDIWKVEGDLPEKVRLSTKSVPGWLNELKEIKVQEPVSATKRMDFPSKAEHQIIVKNGEETLYALEIQNINKDWFLWNEGDSTSLFKVSDYVVEDILHHNEELFNLDSQNIGLSDNLQSIKWNKILPKFSKQDGSWKLDGKGSQPDIGTDIFKDLEKSIADLQVNNFFPGLEKDSLTQLIINTEKGEFYIDDLGPSPFNNTFFITYQDMAYTIPKAIHEKLFPNAEKLISFEKPFEGLGDLKSISFPNFKLQSDEKGDWMSNKDKARTSSIEDWLESFNMILKSPYDPSAGPLAETMIKIELESKDKGKIFLEIGASQKGQTPVKLSSYSGSFLANMDLVKSMNNGRDFFLEKAESATEKE